MSARRRRGQPVPADLEAVLEALDRARDAAARLARASAPPTPGAAHGDREAALASRLRALEQENEALRRHRSADAATPAEAQTDLLAGLYVAASQLHRTLRPEEVVAALQEILINLIGAESFQILLFEPRRTHLRLAANQGPSPPPPRRVAAHDGIVGVVARTGIPFFDPERAQGDHHNPCACVPIRVDAQIVGVIQVERLLPHKGRLTSADHELFTVLAEHAGLALAAAGLYRRFIGAGRAEGVAIESLFDPLAEENGGEPAWNR